MRLDFKSRASCRHEVDVAPLRARAGTAELESQGVVQSPKARLMQHSTHTGTRGVCRATPQKAVHLPDWNTMEAVV